jgi:hypothetical protein
MCIENFGFKTEELEIELGAASKKTERPKPELSVAVSLQSSV